MTLKSITVRKRQLLRSRSALGPSLLTVVRKPQPWKPHTYQKKAMKFLLENAGAGLFLDPGLGKTSIVLGAVKILKQEGLLDKVLIIAPLRVCHNVWPDELRKWTDFHGLTFGILHGSQKNKVLAEKHDIYIINPDGLKWLLTLKNLKKFKPDTLVVDESTNFKHSDTRRFKLLKMYLPRFRRRWILTGSPAPNGLLDLFGQVYILDLGRTLGQYVTHYRAEYFLPVPGDEFTWVPKKDTDKKIHKLLKPLVLRLDAKDYLELPERVVIPVYVELPEDTRRIYDEMEQEMITEIEAGNIVTALSAGSATKKCEQIANGGLYYNEFIDDGTDIPLVTRKWKNLHYEKVTAVTDLVEELSGQQAMIVYDFHHDLDRLKEKLGAVPHIGGGVSPARGKEIENLWNAQLVPEILVQPQSMSHGLNMQTGGNHIIWHSLTWNYEHFDQLIRRILRQGSIHKFVYVHQIIARDTIDEAKIIALRSKAKTQNSLLDALRIYIRSRRKV